MDQNENIWVEGAKGWAKAHGLPQTKETYLKWIMQIDKAIDKRLAEQDREKLGKDPYRN